MSIPDPFSSHPNIKEEKVVWLARLVLNCLNDITIVDSMFHKYGFLIPNENILSTIVCNSSSSKHLTGDFLASKFLSAHTYL